MLPFKAIPMTTVTYNVWLFRLTLAKVKWAKNRQTVGEYLSYATTSISNFPIMIFLLFLSYFIALKLFSQFSLTSFFSFPISVSHARLFSGEHNSVLF